MWLVDTRLSHKDSVMGTCFVMQPFDEDVYDKRYSDVFAPGIKEAGIEPYRVDRDPGVSVPINDIETGIRDAQICFAEITTDNPNVWFELGFAIAAAKEVVLVCSEERKSTFPFDVQHRSIIKYRCGAPQDFVELQKKITERIIALLKKEKEISRASSISPVKDTEGLSQHEIVALVTIVENSFVTGASANTSSVAADMNKAGFTDIATALATISLEQKDMAHTKVLPSGDFGSFCVVEPTRKGYDWLQAHQHLLKLEEPYTPF